MDIKKTIKRLHELHSYTKEIIADHKSFHKLDHNTVDVALVINQAKEYAIYLDKYVFSPWNLWRIRIGRPSTHTVKVMSDLGGKLFHLGNDLGPAWNYPDNQLQRESHPNTFKARERIYANTRDNLYTLLELQKIADGLKRFFQPSDHLLSDRGFKWANIAMGFILGIVSAILGAYFLELLHLSKP